jgi:hypothetical protein
MLTGASFVLAGVLAGGLCLGDALALAFQNDLAFPAFL